MGIRYYKHSPAQDTGREGRKEMNFINTQWYEGHNSITIDTNSVTLTGGYWTGIGVTPGTYCYTFIPEGIEITLSCTKKIQLILFHDGRLCVQEKPPHFFERR
ncbi:MAG: hypothetical protein Pg6C_01840 [Treponemataceae bacterium]|nr:MAG: hypothetical protein Pg6C_01840 [Treponemataceae bacterium]